MAISGRLELGDNILRISGAYWSIFTNHDAISQQSNKIRWKNAKSGLLHRARSFKIIEVGISRKHVCDFLLVINSNWYPISYRFGVIAEIIVQILDTLRFWAPLGGLGTTYCVHLGLIGKRVVDFLLLIISVFAGTVSVWRPQSAR